MVQLKVGLTNYHLVCIFIF